MKNIFLFFLLVCTGYQFRASPKQDKPASATYDQITINVGHDFSFYEVKIPEQLFNDPRVEFDIRLNYRSTIIRWNNNKFLSEKPLIKKTEGFIYLRKNTALKQGDFLSVNCFKNSIPQKRIVKEVKYIRYDLSKLEINKYYESYTLEVPHEVFEDHSIDIYSGVSNKKAFSRENGKWAGRLPEIITAGSSVYLTKTIPLQDGDLVEAHLSRKGKTLYDAQLYVKGNDKRLKTTTEHDNKYYVKDRFLYLNTKNEVLSVVGYSMNGRQIGALPFRRSLNESVIIDLKSLQKNGVFIINILSETGKQSIKIAL